MEKYRFPAEKQALLEDMKIPFAIYQFLDRRAVTLVLSDGLLELLGHTDRDKAVYDMDHDMYRDTHPADVSRAADAAVRFATEGGKYDLVYRSRMRGGEEYRLVHARGEHILTEDGVRLAQVWYADEGPWSGDESAEPERLTEAVSMALRAEDLQGPHRYDHLTGLPNMNHFFSLAEAERAAAGRESRRPVILYLNLSGMKFFNHNNSFDEGDRLLLAFARLLASLFGSERCGRFGQDQFAALAEEEGLEARLEDLFQRCARLNGGNSLPVRVGICRSWTEEVPVSKACDRAKVACDALRNTASSAYRCYDAELRETVEHQKLIQEDLDRAMAEKRIQVWYQPILRAANDSVCNEEALARWVDPERGMLPPASFIPILEDSGQIWKLDLYVVEQVVEKQRLMLEKGYKTVPCSVNLSRSDFDACDMVEEIRSRVDGAGVSRGLIAIEITESIIGSDFDRFKEQIERFRALGFPVWLDDFGSGYSSLDVLQSIRFDLIKLDMSFMRRFNENAGSRVVLTELVKLVNSIGADTVCEGVETEEQARFLQEIGCSKLQGYFFAKPVSLETLLNRHATGGFSFGYENPDEAPYYEAIGEVNLYDLDLIGTEGDRSFQNFFNTLPVGIIEVRDGETRFARSNQAYRDFLKRFLGFDLSREGTDFVPYDDAFMYNVVKTCCEQGIKTFFDERMPNGAIVHSFARRIGVNPVNGTIAVAVAVLSITDEGRGATYEGIARALAVNCHMLYYIDLDSAQFVEYRSSDTGVGLAVERHGEDFFEGLRQKSESLFPPEERAATLAALTKENILKALDRDGIFLLSCRMTEGGAPFDVRARISRIAPNSNRVVLGVSKVTAPERASRFQALVDQSVKPSAILRVQKGDYGLPSEIRIVCANREYKEAMGGGYYDGMRYDELVPRVLHFESSCYRCAILHEQIHSYLQTKVNELWTDQNLLPLHSDEEDAGYCQFIMELSEEKNRDLKASVSSRTAEAVLRATITLLSNSELNKKVETVLGDIMAFSEAFNVRVVLLDHENSRADSYAEKLAVELPPDYVPPAEDPDAAKVSYQLVCSWEDTIGDKDYLVVTNEEEMEELAQRNPNWVNTLRIYQVTSLVLIPLRHEREIIGYLYLANFNVEKVTEVREVAELMSFFLGTEIYNEILLRRLDEMSHTDALTGLNNRNAMIQRTKQLAESEVPVPFGIVNLDLNGLKAVNDAQGHDAGDRLLITAAETLKKFFYQGDLYRTGGDEFIVIATGITKDAFDRKVERLRLANDKGLVCFAIGEYWSDGTTDPTAAFRRADEIMYADKNAYYRAHPEQKR